MGPPCKRFAVLGAALGKDALLSLVGTTVVAQGAARDHGHCQKHLRRVGFPLTYAAVLAQVAFYRLQLAAAAALPVGRFGRVLG